MDTMYEFVREVRGVAKEKNPALLWDAEIVSWCDWAAEETARESSCVRRIELFRALDNVQEYDPRLVLPRYLDKIREAWYRDRELRVIDTKYTGYSLMIPAGSQPTGFYSDSTLFLLWPRPAVTEYSTGTATFTAGSKVVSFAGGADLVAGKVATGWAIGKGATPTAMRRVLSVEDATHLTLEIPWDFPTAAATAYLATDGAVRVAYVGLPDKTILVSEVTGTVTFTQGSPDVLGAGTAFTTTLKVGRWIAKGERLKSEPSRFYRIASIADDTHLTLSEPYAEATVAATKYIGSDPVPLSYGDILAPLNYAMARAYGRYNNVRMADRHDTAYEKAKVEVKRRSAMRYSLGEGHQVREVDATDQLMWRGLGG